MRLISEKGTVLALVTNTGILILGCRIVVFYILQRIL